MFFIAMSFPFQLAVGFKDLILDPDCLLELNWKEIVIVVSDVERAHLEITNVCRGSAFLAFFPVDKVPVRNGAICGNPRIANIQDRRKVIADPLRRADFHD